MHIAQYLMSVATRHEKAKKQHAIELEEYWAIERKQKKNRSDFVMTYEDEGELLTGVVDSVGTRPRCLKKLSLPALGALAYIFMAKLESHPYVQGHEIVEKLVYDSENTLMYLNSFAELKDQKWIILQVSQGMALIEQKPFIWLQSDIELGVTFHKEMGVTAETCRAFTSNDAYLDSVFTYLEAMVRDDSGHYQVFNTESDLKTEQPEGWYRRIAVRVQVSTSPLQAAETIEKYGLSIYQHLALIGLLGLRDGDLNYEFNDPTCVTRLFARGRICRMKMKEHLYGEKSKLMSNRLLEASHSTFGETVRLTQTAVTALIGKHLDKNKSQDLKKRVKKNTLFDLEEPKVKKESVQLPEKVMEAIRSLIFSESKKGKQIRKNWHATLPAAWGSPTGSTVLLYGPPGTGKTLTAQYLASEMKLPLLKIDAARVLSCWVGESEQNVRRIFDDYAALQKELGSAPVLLLNEADQLLGARDAGTTGVDRMNNNMQNLFLEGLERFSGILVATTNRRDLLDEAFSRRFTYKLELPPPDRNLRMELWKSHLPMKRLADDVEIGQLADMGLTGGEIRLVVERAVRLLAYRGISTIDRKTLMDIAKEELACRMKRNGSINKIGFGAVL
jgi:AAA+ superfamily predicted ATPase